MSCEKRLQNQESKVAEYLTVATEEETEWWLKLQMAEERLLDAPNDPSVW